MNSNNTNPPPIAPTFDPTLYDSNYDSDVDLTQEESDEILARNLQEQERESYNLYMATKENSFVDHNDHGNDSSLQLPQSSEPQSPNSGHYTIDEDLARQVEMELKDEEYARSLQQHENENHYSHIKMDESAIGHMDMVQEQKSRSRCTFRRLCSAALLFITIAGVGIFVLFNGSAIWNRLTGGGNEPFFTWEDQDNATQEDFKRWNTKGNNGLKLNIINAMTSDWYNFFDLAVANWEVASALSLTVQMANPDPDCSFVPGKLKACNKEYGLLGWSGLNEALLDSKGFITASTSKMNESYLKGSKYNEKLYVCCHEIGHGFGLPHRDTNVMNPNLGTCLDYTTNFKGNTKPDDVDFKNLENLYGTIKQKRNVRMVHSMHEHAESQVEVNDSIASLGKLNKRSYKDGRLLYKSERKEIYEEVLPDGSRIISTLLLATKDP